MDAIHSAIEHAQQHVSVMCMRDWLTVFSMARSNKKTDKNNKFAKGAYMTRELKYDEFVHLKHLASQIIENRKKDSEEHNLNWLKIQRSRHEKVRPGINFFSYSSTGDYNTLNVVVKGKFRTNNELVLKPLYPKEIQFSMVLFFNGEEKGLGQALRLKCLPQETTFMDSEAKDRIRM